jgi:hypothetical protein
MAALCDNNHYNTIGGRHAPTAKQLILLSKRQPATLQKHKHTDP